MSASVPVPESSTAPETPLLVVDDVHKAFPVRGSAVSRLRRTPGQAAIALDGVSLSLARSGTLGIVGESGSGKSTLARCLLRLIEPDAGSIRLDGVELGGLDRAGLRAMRGRAQMVFQDPYGSLNPRMSIADAIAEAALVHEVTDRRGADAHVARMLELVGLPATSGPRRPRELSGGQRQRAAIARALAVEPELLVADEAVSALDVSVQAQILNLLCDLRAELGLTMVFIAHQLAVVRHLCDRVAIMYLGRIVEQGPVETVFREPAHPYTAALLEAMPGSGAPHRALVGDVPSPLAIPSGCRFRTRCTRAMARCELEDPARSLPAPDHEVYCHLHDERRGVAP